MKSIGNILQSINKEPSPSTKIRCNKCGKIHQLVGNQYTVVCSQCGLHITITSKTLRTMKEDAGTYESKCGICKDTGLVFLDKQIDDYVGEFAYRCICQKGQNNKKVCGFPTIPQKYLQDWYGKDQTLTDFAEEVIENCPDPFQEVSNHETNSSV